MAAGNEPELTHTPFRSEGEKRYMKGNGDRYCRRNCETGVLEGVDGEHYCFLVCKPFVIWWKCNGISQESSAPVFEVENCSLETEASSSSQTCHLILEILARSCSNSV